ncbi:MAG: MerR family transcriptional regulator [Pseudomonadota bacterium]
MQQYSIGAVAKLTNIPAHTLRKWESRHGIGAPERSATGRRVYSDQDIELLHLVRALIAEGHALAHLASLNLDELRKLAPPQTQHGTSPATPTSQIAGISLVGPTIASLLTSEQLVSVQRSNDSAARWLQQNRQGPTDYAVVLECDTLPQHLAQAITRLTDQQPVVIVVYTFAESRTLNRLREAGVITLRGPVDEQLLLMHLTPMNPTNSTDGLSAAKPPAASTVPQSRFTRQELARLAALKPGLQCECPNHIAQLLMDISAFERYSAECIDSDPTERELHAQLSNMAGQARRLLEDALISVARADGIALQMQDPT